MIIGTGIDIVELERIKKILSRQKKFVDRILTTAEKEKFFRLSESRQIEFLAGRFAIKEAFSKAVGTGIGGNLSFLDIEVLSDERGKPVLTKPTNHKAHLSITHSKEFVVAQVILESLSS